MATTKIQKQCIRYSTVEDFEAVMAIDEHVFEGADYLPNVYEEFMNDPMTRCYVLEFDNVVVGCCEFLFGYSNFY